MRSSSESSPRTEAIVFSCNSYAARSSDAPSFSSSSSRSHHSGRAHGLASRRRQRREPLERVRERLLVAEVARKLERLLERGRGLVLSIQVETRLAEVQQRERQPLAVPKLAGERDGFARPVIPARTCSARPAPDRAGGFRARAPARSSRALGRARRRATAGPRGTRRARPSAVPRGRARGCTARASAPGKLFGEKLLELAEQDFLPPERELRIITQLDCRQALVV
jgi:hypothetical protein